MDEIRMCPSFPHYGVTEDGRVFRMVRTFPHDKIPPYEMKQREDKDGYLIVGHSMKVHRLVADAFIPNSEGKPQVAHNNGVRSDNRVDNLRWATCGENHADKRAHKTLLHGDTSPARKLSSGQVIFFRNMASAGVSHTDLAKLAPVCRSVLSRAISGRTWV